MTKRWIVVAAIAALTGGCDTLSKGPYAEAQIKGLDGSSIWGRITFHQPQEGVARSMGFSSSMGESAVGKTYIHADINGLPPNRQFGFHIHEKGDCSAKDFTSAGGHFNPEGKPHGRYSAPDHHLGDLPNLMSNGEGIAVFAYDSETIKVAPGPDSVVNRAIVIHEKPDDYKTQPTGNSGARIACGVIREVT